MLQQYTWRYTRHTKAYTPFDTCSDIYIYPLYTHPLSSVGYRNIDNISMYGYILNDGIIMRWIQALLLYTCILVENDLML